MTGKGANPTSRTLQVSPRFKPSPEILYGMWGGTCVGSEFGRLISKYFNKLDKFERDLPRFLWSTCMPYSRLLAEVSVGYSNHLETRYVHARYFRAWLSRAELTRLLLSPT